MQYLQTNNSILSNPILQQFQETLEFGINNGVTITVLTKPISKSLHYIMDSLCDLINHYVVFESAHLLKFVFTKYKFWIHLFSSDACSDYNEYFNTFINSQIVSSVSPCAIQTRLTNNESLIDTFKILQLHNINLSYENNSALKLLLYGLNENNIYKEKILLCEAIEYLIQHLDWNQNNCRNPIQNLDCKNETHPIWPVTNECDADWCTYEAFQVLNKQRKQYSIQLQKLLMSNQKIIYNDICGIISELVWGDYQFQFDVNNYDICGDYKR
eukprot:504411_1